MTPEGRKHQETYRDPQFEPNERPEIEEETAQPSPIVALLEDLVEAQAEQTAVLREILETLKARG